MAGKQFLKKHENCILSLAMALILAGILAARFDGQDGVRAFCLCDRFGQIALRQKFF